MEHEHGDPKGPPYDHNAPITCPRCRKEMQEFIINEYRKGCERYGTNFDIRKIADMLRKYEI